MEEVEEEAAIEVEAVVGAPPAAHSMTYTKPGWMTFTFRWVRWAKADSSKWPP